MLENGDDISQLQKDLDLRTRVLQTADVNGYLLASVQNKVAYWLDRLINEKKIGPDSLPKVFIKRQIPKNGGKVEWDGEGLELVN